MIVLILASSPCDGVGRHALGSHSVGSVLGPCPFEVAHRLHFIEHGKLAFVLLAAHLATRVQKHEEPDSVPWDTDR